MTYNKMHIQPKSIKRKDTSGIEIVWQNGSENFISSKILRDNCPSAISRMQRGDDSHDKPINTSNRKKFLLKVIEHSAQESYSMEKIWQVGNYAIGIKWKDGHDSGIYSYSLLKELTSTENEKISV